MFNATVSSNVHVHEDLFRLSVRMDQGIASPYQPGQYMAIGLPKPGDSTGKKFVKRAYSLCSTPDAHGELEFFISIVPGGELSPRLSQLQSGERIMCGPKITGTFVLEHVPDKSHLVLVSTGTGIAPYISMLRTKNTWERFEDIVIIHGVRFEKDLAYTEELEALCRNKPGLRYVPIVSRAQGEWSGEKGRIQRLFTERLVEIDPERSQVFLCGNPAMIEEAQALLESFGLKEHSKKEPTGNIHVEKYW